MSAKFGLDVTIFTAVSLGLLFKLCKFQYFSCFRRLPQAKFMDVEIAVRLVYMLGEAVPVSLFIFWKTAATSNHFHSYRISATTSCEFSGLF